MSAGMVCTCWRLRADGTHEVGCVFNTDPEGVEPAAQAVPIPSDWPARSQRRVDRLLGKIRAEALKAAVLGETAQGDADALHAAVLDCLDIYESALGMDVGPGAAEARRARFAAAATAMHDRLLELAGPNVSRETSDDDDA